MASTPPPPPVEEAQKEEPTTVEPSGSETQQQLQPQPPELQEVQEPPVTTKDEDEAPPPPNETPATTTTTEVAEKWPGWPGDNVFRLIVPVLKVGSIIGRKGELVKKMCEETRARIRILEGPIGTADRIVCPFLLSYFLCLLVLLGFAILSSGFVCLTFFF